MKILRDSRYELDDQEFLISEIFYTIQGEGKHAGTPSLFIRLCYCNRKCSFCDTEFDTVNKRMSLEEMKKLLEEYSGVPVVWTGGEPLLHWESLVNLQQIDGKYQDWHIETDGDFLGEVKNEIGYREMFDIIDYLVCSPKGVNTAKKVHQALVIDEKPFSAISNEAYFEIKVVTDLETMNLDLIPYATSLMPLSFEDELKTKETKKKVAEYCIKNKVRFSPRLQVDIWGYAKRGV